MAILTPIDARIPPFMAYTYAYIWCSMIAPIDGSDPPEPPLTPVTFDSQIRSIRAKFTRGWPPGHATSDIWRRFARYSYAVRQRQDFGHEWGLGHEWNRARAISGAIHGGHVGGAFYSKFRHSHEPKTFALESRHSITQLNRLTSAYSV